MHGAETKGIF